VTIKEDNIISWVGLHMPILARSCLKIVKKKKSKREFTVISEKYIVRVSKCFSFLPSWEIYNQASLPHLFPSAYELAPLSPHVS
jgi:hypothetical protein